LKLSAPSLLNNINVEIYDMTGKKISEIQSIQINKEFYISREALPTGIYLIKLFNDKETRTKKIVM
jgi:hypothetical protein